ncbi:STAS domain-containing protein [Methylogaea oryzae]|uniref:Anti-sigma factor antagonist n=1 Tax=Methylogaea oryzae TaxID=1295382 RepID=A0A8D4VN52_9GAMM|nr:STAS domain-containing protein [Methylogaea oryzae]BBL69612.1 anti-sigma factor antagonist [Methylogaea oryzae]
MLNTSTHKQGDILVVTLDGRIDASSAKPLEEQFLQWIDGGEHRLVIDFSGVNYISSAGLRVFLLVAKRIGAAEGSVKLCALNPTLREVFDISGFSRLFDIAATVQETL